MSNRRLLIAVAHPDDESFGYGGLITKYVAQGVDVYLIVSTNGDAGTVTSEFLNGYRSVAELRLAELDCAAQKLGFKKVFKFGYKDSGMMGSETSKDPDCSWQAPREELARKVVEVIREVKPQVIITFNRYGGYGHPDHIAIQRATTDAFTLAGDASYVTEGQSPYQPQKLYYSSFPKMLMRWNILRVRLKGQDPRRLGRNKDIDIVKILENAEPVHTLVDVREYLEAWDEASACHASQLGGGSMPQLPMWLRRIVRGRQGFTRIFPPPAANRVDEYDLFDGVRLDEPLGVA
ncbi:MAG TPA: PIG-L family deacetylase [Spirillospora sp.]|nr:PIG-L family deacetylase [Spirillospora sp.]